MATTFTFEIVTPDKMLYSTAEATCVSFQTLSGSMGIEAKHLPVIASLAIAPVKVTLADGHSEFIAVSGGFLEMNGTKCTVLATAAELAKEIDVERAELAKKRAEDRLAAKAEDLDVKRAMASLQRATVRLKLRDL